MHALISSKFDYCNNVLYGLTAYKLEKLQLRQNTATMLNVRAKKSTHITPILKNLRRRAVKEGINFKILLS